MATVRIETGTVMRMAREARAAVEAKRIIAREDAICTLLKYPTTVGRWPFRRLVWRTRDQAEAEYSAPDVKRFMCFSYKDVVERGYRREAARIQKILDAASAASGHSDGYVSLSEDEVLLIEGQRSSAGAN